MKLISIILSLLMVFSLTTALVGKPAPSLDIALQKLSYVRVDIDEVLSNVVEATEGVLIAPVVIPEDTNFIVEAFYDLANSLIMIINTLFGGVAGAFVIITMIDDIWNIIVSFVDIGVYLLFGIYIDTDVVVQ